MRAIRFNLFTEEDEQVEWLVDGLLPNVGWTLLVGEKGIGKTTWCLQMCVAIQLGIPFFGKHTKQADILYLQADSPTLEWKEIVRRIAPESRGVTCVDVEDKFLNNSKYCDTLSWIIQKVQPGLCVFDSLYNITSANINTENVLVPVNQLKSLCVVNGTAIPFIIIHHPPHGETRASGHNSLSANCSNEWFLSRQKFQVKKGRLVKGLEILLSRDEQGLWIERKRENDQRNYNNYGIPI